MKKIFILTGEPSGDKLASKVISKLQKNDPNIEYSCVGGTHLNSLGIKSIFELKEITYIGFTSVLLNIFKIKNKINKTVEEIIRFNPDVLFSVDSPDFTLRVAEKVKKLNNKIKTVHYVAPQVWVWREGRVKKIKKFLDHILLSVDSPDFTLRVAEKVKYINNSIKTIHYVAPQVWIWRKNRIKKIKKFIDHMLLLFDFEKNILIKKVSQTPLLVILC